MTDTGSLIVRSPHGLHVPAADLYLDARRAPGLVFVSHAHSDHCSSAPRIVCTPETAAFHRRRRASTETLALRFGQPLSLGDSTLELSSAGHTVGSAMAIVRTGDGTIAYTGDYKLRAGPFSGSVTIPQCDTLVMECTFGHPRYRFPTEGELLAQLFEFIDKALAADATPVVLAYAFGKAQDALYHLTGRGYDVTVDDVVARMCDLHVELGHAFPPPGTWKRYEGSLPGSTVVLTTPGGRSSPMVRGLRRKRVVHLTGWGCHPGARAMFRGCDLVLPLSGHADFDELVRMARESGARKIYTVHGSTRFAAHLRSIGLDAEHLGSHPQRLTSAPMRDTDRDAATSRQLPQLSLAL